MPQDELGGDGDRVFSTRITYIEQELREIKSDLKRLDNREIDDNAAIKTRLALAERDIKWWGILAGLFGGFGFELVAKFFR